MVGILDVQGLTNLTLFSRVADAYSTDINTVSDVFLGSLILGFVMLTLLFNVYSKKSAWLNYKYPEKLTISFAVGLLAIIFSSIAVELVALLIKISIVLVMALTKTTLDGSIEGIDLLVSAVYLASPIMYIAIFAKNASNLKKVNDNFIGHYIKHTISNLGIVSALFIILMFSAGFNILIGYVINIVSIVTLIYCYRQDIDIRGELVKTKEKYVKNFKKKARTSNFRKNKGHYPHCCCESDF